MLQESLTGISKMFQGYFERRMFKGVSKKFKGYKGSVKQVSGKIQECVKKVRKVLLEKSLKVVSRLFQGSFVM